MEFMEEGSYTLNQLLFCWSLVQVLLQAIDGLASLKIMLGLLNRAISCQLPPDYNVHSDRAHGAAEVSWRMFLSFKSCGSGRSWRCLSKESRRTTGEIDEVSMFGSA